MIHNTFYSKTDYVKFQNKGGDYCAHKEEQEVNSNLDECVEKKKTTKLLRTTWNQPSYQKHLGLHTDGDLRREVGPVIIRKSLNAQSLASGCSFIY